MFETDVLVIGSGAAGLAAAAEAHALGARVILATGAALLSGSSPRAQGGVAAAVGADDNVGLHRADTLAAGGGLSNTSAVRVLVDDGVDITRQLVRDGAPFEGGSDGPALGLEAGHSRRRILHAGGGATGLWLTRFLVERVVASGITILENARCVELLACDGRVRGAYFDLAGSDRVRLEAGAVVLATGGAAALWRRTTNAPETRGVGIGIAWRAGATLADLEMVQFHPTALVLDGRPAFLLSEALRGEGALLVDAEERSFVDPLQPRDVVARAVASQAETGGAYLTMRHLDPDRVHEAFPSLSTQVAELGLDLARDLLPVAPAAHYLMGGVRTNLDGCSDVPGLYAAGEVACTGAQGANRLASNSLLECLVFGRRAARAAVGHACDEPRLAPTSLPLPDGAGEPSPSGLFELPNMSYRRSGRAGACPPPLDTAPTSPGGRGQAPPLPDEKAMPGTSHPFDPGCLLDRYVGVVRDDPGLNLAVARLPDPDHPETAPDLVVAGLVARAALLRRESRGAHFRSDFPATDPRWRGRILWRRGLPPAFEPITEDQP